MITGRSPSRPAFCAAAQRFDQTALLFTVTALPLARPNYAQMPDCPLGISFVSCRLTSQRHIVPNTSSRGALEKEVAQIHLNSNWLENLTVAPRAQRSYSFKRGFLFNHLKENEEGPARSPIFPPHYGACFTCEKNKSEAPGDFYEANMFVSWVNHMQEK